MRIALALPVLERVHGYFKSEANFVQNVAAVDLHDRRVDALSPDACRFCTLGAIAHFSNALHPRSLALMEKADHDATALLTDIIRETHPELTIVGSNDRKGWKFVQRMLCKAIDRYNVKK